MKILVTGNLGFVGSETVTLLRDHEHDVIGLDIMCPPGDIRDYAIIKRTVERYGPDRILHLAAIARFAEADRDPARAYEVNVVGTALVCRAAQEFHIPIVYASTGSAIMPLDAYHAPYDETIPARGNSVYGVTKALGEYIVRQHTPHIVLRYAHIYGKEKRGHGLVGGFMDRIQRGLAPRLYGGQQTNDFVYIKDVARANVVALEASWDKWDEIYNVGTGQELAMREAGELICRLAGFEGNIEVHDGRAVDPSRFVFDVSKAKTCLGFSAEFAFESGLRDMLGIAYRMNLSI